MISEIVVLAALILGHKDIDSCAHIRSELPIATVAGHTLAGELTTPHTGRNPVIIMIGGSGKSERSYDTNCCNNSSETLLNALICLGIGVVRFDEVGTGKSGGSYEAYATTMSLANDVKDIVAMLVSDRRVDSTRIYLLGHSEGAVIAAIVASQSTQVAGVIALSAPYFAGREIVELQSAVRVAHGELSADSALRESTSRALNEKWYRYFLHFDPSLYYRNLSQPILIIHGTEDWKVTWQQAVLIYGAANANRIDSKNSCILLDGVGHALSRREGGHWEFDPRVLMQIERWFGALGAGGKATRACVRLPVD